MRSGEIIKSKNSAVTAQELELINSYTRRPFTEEEVYVFTVVLCDNDVDRDFERFTVEALFQMEKLFVGRTGIYDHSPRANNQTARIFSCSVEAVQGRKTATGDDYFRLVARAYMPRCKSTEDVIMQIESGIRKEVSVGISAKHSRCSVCAGERGDSHCGHIKGETYAGQICYFELYDVTDAYEWSFVAVPAQREAGVIKSFEEPRKKENEGMENIMKSLSQGESVTLCVSEAKRLYDHITDLEKRARQGDEYRQEIENEVLRLSAVAKCGISRETMESALKGLSVSQLKEFAEVYRKKAEDIFMPQTKTQGKACTKTAGNKEFRI